LARSAALKVPVCHQSTPARASPELTASGPLHVQRSSTVHQHDFEMGSQTQTRPDMHTHSRAPVIQGHAGTGRSKQLSQAHQHKAHPKTRQAMSGEWHTTCTTVVLICRWAFGRGGKGGSLWSGTSETVGQPGAPGTTPSQQCAVSTRVDPVAVNGQLGPTTAMSTSTAGLTQLARAARPPASSASAALDL
jgi:hypothetical protein